MRKFVSIMALGFFMTGAFAMPIEETVDSKTRKKTQLRLKKLNVVEVSSGRLYVFEYSASHRLKVVKSKDSFIGVKKGSSKIVDFYVDSTKLPLTIAGILKDVDSSMSMEERIKVGNTVGPRLFRFEEDKDSIYIHFNKKGMIEIGAAN